MEAGEHGEVPAHQHGLADEEGVRVRLPDGEAFLVPEPDLFEPGRGVFVLGRDLHLGGELFEQRPDVALVVVEAGEELRRGLGAGPEPELLGHDLEVIAEVRRAGRGVRQRRHVGQSADPLDLVPVLESLRDGHDVDRRPLGVHLDELQPERLMPEIVEPSRRAALGEGGRHALVWGEQHGSEDPLLRLDRVRRELVGGAVDLGRRRPDGLPRSRRRGIPAVVLRRR